MKNDVLDFQESRQGIYTAYHTINGKTSWKSDVNAIWYVQAFNDWAIGNIEDIGTTIREITSHGDHGDKGPFEVPNDKWMGCHH